jgi:hypothetical protein
MSKVLKETTKDVCAKHNQDDELSKLILNWIVRIENGNASAEDAKEGLRLAEQLVEKVKLS